MRPDVARTRAADAVTESSTSARRARSLAAASCPVPRCHAKWASKGSASPARSASLRLPAMRRARSSSASCRLVVLGSVEWPRAKRNRSSALSVVFRPERQCVLVVRLCHAVAVQRVRAVAGFAEGEPSSFGELALVTAGGATARAPTVHGRRASPRGPPGARGPRSTLLSSRCFAARSARAICP